MNFNLISPKDNGYDYNTRFREDIVVNPNSKVYLNFASLSKLNSVNFTEQQTITMNSTDLYPIVIPDALASPNHIVNQTATIKKGSYTFTEFQTELQKALTTIKTNNGKQLYYYSTALSNGSPTDKSHIVIGYFLDEDSNWKLKDAIIDSTDAVGFGANGDNAYVKTTADASPQLTYDAYAGTSTHYFHHSYLCSEQAVNNNVIVLESSHDIEALQGKIGFGLYSPENTTIKGGGANFIGGANLPLVGNVGPTALSNQTPKAYIWCEIHQQQVYKYLRVYEGRIGATQNTNRLNTFDFDSNMNNRQQVFYSNLNNHYAALDQPLRIAFQTYIRTTNDNFKGEERKVHYRIYLLNDTHGINGLDPNDAVFDSYNYLSYFNYDFFNTYANPVSKAQAGSGIPFKIIMSAQKQDEGWKSCVYREFDKSTDDATSCNSIVNSYTLQFSEQLADYLEVRQTPSLYPNACELMLNSPSFYYQKNLALDFLNDSYSIILEQLPIANYKNKENSADGGYSQNILANIPAPFYENYNNSTKDSNLLGATYEPNFKVISTLKNQLLRINNFRVRIINMRTNEPATELLQSIINFTIDEGPPQSD